MDVVRLRDESSDDDGRGVADRDGPSDTDVDADVRKTVHDHWLHRPAVPW